MTKSYIVGVREVHVRHYMVKAKDEDQAREFVGGRGREVTDLEFSEFSHELSRDTWSVEEETRKGG
jgi:hypothetical protein